MSIRFLPAVKTLQQAIETLLDNKNSDQVLGVEITHLDPISADSFPKPYFYWKSRSCQARYHAWGISELFTSFDQIPKSQLPRFGCFRFSSQEKNRSIWSNFPKKMLWTPIWCLKEDGNQDGKNILYFSSRSLTLPITDTVDSELPSEIPNKETWIQNILRSQQKFNKTTLKKIVLARQSKRHCTNPNKLFEELQTLQQKCYHFCFAPNNSEMFFGVSPERLLRVQNSTLYTEALAGTISRSSNQEQNSKLSEELFRSTKDQHEHDIVSQYIQEALKPFSEEICIEPKEILSLHHVQHIRTPIIASLKKDYSLDEILHILHPTPAVCGLPKQQAMETISLLEDFERGFYAGTMGMITEDVIDFTVSIRSALWKNNQLLVWAGAGIVSQSDPKQEWIELNNKAKQFFERSEL